MLEDHALHFYFLGGPDFVVGPKAPAAKRNVLGVIEEVGIEAGKKVIGIRKELRELEAIVGGKTIHPVCGLPGGISKPLSEEDRKKFIEAADHALEFAFFTLELFNTKVLKNPEYVELIKSDTYTHKTYYMGLVDEQNKVNFYDGDIRVVSPSGEEFIKFEAKDYIKHIAEHVELWSYVKFLYLKGVGWKGFVEGEESGVYSVAPLARLNASDGMATPRAQEAYEKFFETLGKPVHHTLANHWARVVEMVYAAERIGELAKDSEITDPKVRVVCEERPSVGIGVVEAPRGTLFHHYETDERGIIQKANLIVATQNNAARIAMSVETAAKDLIKEGKVDDGILNMVEMAFRAYDPCHACATHTLPGQMPLVVKIYNAEGDLIKQLSR
jgi:F420-non-reducing hydrogenase large subunit